AQLALEGVRTRKGLLQPGADIVHAWGSLVVGAPSMGPRRPDRKAAGRFDRAPGRRGRYFPGMTTSSRTVRIGLVQQRVGPDPAANLERAIEGIREAAGRGAQVVCLQELFGWYYFCQREDHEFFKLAEPIPGPSTERLGAVAGELGVAIVASLFE